MWYLKNTSQNVLIEPESGKQMLPGEIKVFNSEYTFLRFLACHNGSVAVVTENEYNQYTGALARLAKEQKIAQAEANSETQEVEEIEETEQPQPKKGRPKKQ
jgi:hypothetical protein